MKFSIPQIKLLFTCFLAGSLIVLSGCKKDDDGADRSDFVATYSVIETCGAGNDSYDITITESSTSDDGILIANLYDWDETATATVDGDNLTIPSQLLDGLTFSGTGTLDGNELTINFQVAFGPDSDNCSAACTKK